MAAALSLIFLIPFAPFAWLFIKVVDIIPGANAFIDQNLPRFDEFFAEAPERLNALLSALFGRLF